MKTHTKIQKWGNGLALRISGVMREIPHFKEGTEVDVEITTKGFLVTKSVQKEKYSLPFSEQQLIESLSPELAHADLLAAPLDKEVAE